MKPFRPAKKRITVSPGESVRIIRELQGHSQNELADLTGIPQATLSAIENDRIRLGVERARTLARAPEVSPGGLGLLGMGNWPGLSGLTWHWTGPTPARPAVRLTVEGSSSLFVEATNKTDNLSTAYSRYDLSPSHFQLHA
jgi:transcriptional regulator with XRE-family HTH domain